VSREGAECLTRLHPPLGAVPAEGLSGLSIPASLAAFDRAPVAARSGDQGCDTGSGATRDDQATGTRSSSRTEALERGERLGMAAPGRLLGVVFSP